MNQSTLCSHFAAPAGVSRATADADLTPLHPEPAESLARNETVALAGSGTFSTRARGARERRNPATGERIAVPAVQDTGVQGGEDAARIRQRPKPRRVP